MFQKWAYTIRDLVILKWSLANKAMLVTKRKVQKGHDHFGFKAYIFEISRDLFLSDTIICDCLSLRIFSIVVFSVLITKDITGA